MRKLVMKLLMAVKWFEAGRDQGKKKEEEEKQRK